MSRITLDKKSVADKIAIRENGSKQDSKKLLSDDNKSLMKERLVEPLKDNLSHYGNYHRETIFENTFKLVPDPKDKFDCELIDRIIHNLLKSELENAVYTSEFAQKMSLVLTKKILNEVKVKSKRYKLVAILNIGDSKDRPSIHLFSRCLWNSSTDSYSSVVFNNSSFYAVATVFAVYFE